MSTSRSALYPLTVCDLAQQRIHIAQGWVIEGAIDVDIVKKALDKVVDKWRMLAGRVDVRGKEAFIRIPLGKLPKDYQTYTLTYRDSSVPLSHYTPIPIPSFSEVLPGHLFLSDEPKRLGLTDLSHADYAAKDAPLTHWHVTRFAQKGQEYSCVGFTFPHGVFDGLSAGFVVHALEAELAGRDWAIPPPRLPGLVYTEERLLNPLYTRMKNEVLHREGEDTRTPLDYFPAVSLVGLYGMLLWVVQWIWVSLTQGAGHWSIIIPYEAHTRLAQETRKQAQDVGLTEVRPGTNDAIFCWLLKSLFLGGDDELKKTVALYSQATLRTEWDGEIALYPHNCNVGQSLPTFTTEELATAPLYQLAYKMAKGRQDSPRRRDATRFWKIWEEAAYSKSPGFVVPQVDGGESITLTNLSMARTGTIDLAPAGGGRTLANFLFSKNQLGLNPLNFGIINGRLDNGDLVLTLYTTRDRAKRVGKELIKLHDMFG